MTQTTDLMSAIKKIALDAGNAIMNIYDDANLSSVVDHKADDSPLTLADQASHKVIQAGLETIEPKFPILSEEGKSISYEERKIWDTFWLVDPLDGTKEFIKRNGQFTVNIALIKDGYPIMGVIYVPAQEVFYVGSELGAFKTENGKEQPITVNNSKDNRVAVRSASHASPEEDELLNQYKVTESISKGSSLKFCMVAEGKADIYYRHGPTMEWDTAAGQAVLEAAGGSVSRIDSDQRFYYNRENLLNPSFLCKGF